MVIKVYSKRLSRDFYWLIFTRLLFYWRNLIRIPYWGLLPSVYPKTINRTTKPICSASFWYVFFSTGLPSNEVTYQVSHPSRRSVKPGPSSPRVLPQKSGQLCNTALETNDCSLNRLHSRTFHFWMFLALRTQVSLSIQVPVRQTLHLPLSLRFSLAQQFQVTLFMMC
jgi:hypothetical protein